MKAKNYYFITQLAEIKGEAKMTLYGLGSYPVIMYFYPTRTRVITFNNAIEAKDDFEERINFLSKTYNIELTMLGREFLKNPNYVWGIR